MNSLKTRLEALLGSDAIIADRDALMELSTDLFGGNAIAALAMRPRSAERLGEAVAAATEAGFALIPRGGGLSYTGGAVPPHDRCIIVDVGALDRIVSIDAGNMTITVEAGVTWRALYAALKSTGLRLPFFGTFSGSGATVGGGLSNGALFMGSARYGTVADILLSVTVVLANGDTVCTGQAAHRHCIEPVQRNYGPDVAGLFLHDSGAFGIKTQATFRLIRTPAYSDFASFSFDDIGTAAACLSDAARSGAAEELYVFDPTSMKRRLEASDIQSSLRALRKVVGARGKLLQGVRDGVELVVAGKRFVDSVGFALHACCSGRSAASVEADIETLRQIAARHNGREFVNSIPKTVRADPFPHVNGVIGMTDGRWAALNSMVSHGSAPKLVASWQPQLDEHGIVVTRVMLAISTHIFLYEPVFHWADSWLPVQRRAAQPRYLATLTEPAANEVARAAVASLRQAMIRLFDDFGAASVQLARTYPYLAALRPGTRALVTGAKAMVDPRGLMNPGSLGL
jgi:FAD/FMN-containing dehydrogenase